MKKRTSCRESLRNNSAVTTSLPKRVNWIQKTDNYARKPWQIRKFEPIYRKLSWQLEQLLSQDLVFELG